MYANSFQSSSGTLNSSFYDEIDNYDYGGSSVRELTSEDDFSSSLDRSQDGKSLLFDNMFISYVEKLVMTIVSFVNSVPQTDYMEKELTPSTTNSGWSLESEEYPDSSFLGDYPDSLSF